MPVSIPPGPNLDGAERSSASPAAPTRNLLRRPQRLSSGEIADKAPLVIRSHNRRDPVFQGIQEILPQLVGVVIPDIASELDETDVYEYRQ